MSNRLADIQSNLEKINSRIAQACSRSKRNISEITLIAVTKTYPASDVDLLKQLGIENVGENKDQEASGKISQVKEKFSWHFIGQLQSNKAKSVVTYAELVHSVDRLSLAKELQKSASAIAKKQKVLIQVDLDQSGPDPSRGGVWPADLAALAQFISQSENLELTGLMSVAPLGENPSKAFERLAQIRSDFLKNYPNAVILSAGMSEDLEAAIEHGATHLRIGSALLGERPKI
ncbi:MAG: YggS family pyridoxal phosphate-dependent enzyme, partial [Actinomycetes bacterium]